MSYVHASAIGSKVVRFKQPSNLKLAPQVAHVRYVIVLLSKLQLVQ